MAYRLEISDTLLIWLQVQFSFAENRAQKNLKFIRKLNNESNEETLAVWPCSRLTAERRREAKRVGNPTEITQRKSLEIQTCSITKRRTLSS